MRPVAAAGSYFHEGGAGGRACLPPPMAWDLLLQPA
jgi:hypothetical protein